MATRRCRIKGIANIPQRRKVENKADDNEPKKEEIKVVNEVKDAVENKSNNVAPEPVKQQKKEEAPRRRPFIKPTINTKLLVEKAKLKVEVKEPEKLFEEQLNVPEPCPTSSTDVTESERSDTETQCPLSPTKFMNRSRIKAIPRLGQRRISSTFYGSASESEDDTRKLQKRTKTDSICSNVDLAKDKKKEFSSVIQRKCKRTEQSRKMAEAKRHFMHKFGTQPPDKQKLTMIDLIFYNPTSNPMSQKPKKQLMEEQTDDPTQKEETEEQVEEEDPLKSDEEEDALPAPQIKIGANGEIVIDEKSLIIENLQTKRDREELQKSKIVDGDFDTGYGVFKREKRSKDWSKAETIRFYKALNTLGTDFTLMMELFSGRTRRELKMKFKKEERVNRALVDKALTQPMQFDITELRKEVEEEQQRREEEAEEKKQKEAYKQISYIARAKSKEKSTRKRKISDKRDIYSKLAKGVASVWSSDSDNELEEDPLELRPTRSGRVPKPKKPFSYEESIMAIERRESVESREPVEENMNDMNNLQPGSVVILTSQTPNGQPTFKVFMVTPNQSRVPLALTSDVVDNLTQSANNQLEQNVTTQNVTIPENTSETESCNVLGSIEENVIVPENINILENETVSRNITIQETDPEGITQQWDIITLPLDGEITQESVEIAEVNKIDLKMDRESFPVEFTSGINEPCPIARDNICINQFKDFSSNKESVVFSTENNTREQSVGNNATEESVEIEVNQTDLKIDYQSFPIEFTSENSELCTIARENIVS